MKVSSKQLFLIQCPPLTDVDLILSNKSEVQEQPIIYFLIQGNEIVYIGKSINGVVRIYNHLSDKTKQFTHYYYHKVPAIYLNLLEKKYIEKYTPKYNTMFNIKKNPEKKYTIDENGKKIFRIQYKHKCFFNPYGHNYKKKIDLYK